VAKPKFKMLSIFSSEILVGTALCCCGLMLDAGLLLCTNSHSPFCFAPLQKAKNDMLDAANKNGKRL
jgi:hypothetical protein